SGDSTATVTDKQGNVLWQGGDQRDPWAGRASFDNPLGPLALVSHPVRLAGVRGWTMVSRACPPLDRWPWTSFNYVAYSPDNRWLAMGGPDGVIRLYDAESGLFRRAILVHADRVRQIAWSPDGSTLASASADKTVRLWETTSWRLVHTLQGHEVGVWSVAWSPDGKTLASGGDAGDGTVRLWQASTGQLLETWHRHKGTVYCVAWSRDGKSMASSSWDGAIRIWNVGESKTPPRELPVNDIVLVATWSPDGTKLFSG